MSYGIEAYSNSSFSTALREAWKAKAISISPSSLDEPFLTFGTMSDIAVFNIGGLSEPFRQSNSSCYDSHTGERNCTSFCQNATLLFGNRTKSSSGDGSPDLDTAVPWSLLACMYYPTISQLLVADYLDELSRTSLKKLASDYNIVENASLELIGNISGAQRDCFTFYCDFQVGGGHACSNYTGYAGENTLLTGPGLLGLCFPDWSAVSNSTEVMVNTDIGGIGVSIAYMIQFSIIMLIWLSHQTLRICAFAAQRSSYHSQHSVLHNDDEAHNPIIPTARESRRVAGHRFNAPSWTTRYGQSILPLFSKTREAIMDLLYNFQTAQCFFLIPLNLSILVGITRSRSIYSTKSLGQMAKNMAYSQCVTQGGVVFATTTLYLLTLEESLDQKAEQKKRRKFTTISSDDTRDIGKAPNKSRVDFYSWSMTMITVTLGTVAWSRSFKVDPASLIDPDKGSSGTNWIAWCGLVSPAAYNGEKLRDRWIYQNDWQNRLPIIVCNWFVLVGLLIHVLRKQLPPYHPVRRILQHVRQAFGKPWMIRTILSFTEIALLVCLGFFVWDFTNLMRPSLPSIDDTFTMGQMLAIFVWSGTIVDGVFKLVEGILVLRRVYEHGGAFLYSQGSIDGDSGYEDQVKLVNVEETRPDLSRRSSITTP